MLNKATSTTPDPMQPWLLTDQEREELAAARADFRLAKQAHAAARKKGPQGPSANFDAEILGARDRERLARMRLDGVKEQLRSTVQRRLTPPELLEED